MIDKPSRYQEELQVNNPPHGMQNLHAEWIKNDMKAGNDSSETLKVSEVTAGASLYLMQMALEEGLGNHRSQSWAGES